MTNIGHNGIVQKDPLLSYFGRIELISISGRYINLDYSGTVVIDWTLSKDSNTEPIIVHATQQLGKCLKPTPTFPSVTNYWAMIMFLFSFLNYRFWFNKLKSITTSLDGGSII